MATSYIIDITSEALYPLNIGKQWCILTPKPPKKYKVVKPHIDKTVFLQIGRKHEEKERVNEMLEIDPDIEIDDEKNLFGIIYDGKEIPLLEEDRIEIKLNNDKTYFQLLLNPSAIKDCKKAQNDTKTVYEITLPLSLTNENGEEIAHKTEVIKIKFSEVHTKPKVEIVINNEWKSFLFNRDMNEETIGNVKISNPAKFKYFPSIDFEAKLNVTLNGKSVDGNLVRLDFTNVFHDSLTVNNEIANAFSVEDYKSTVLKDKGCLIEKEIEIPIVADIKRMGNPYEAPSRTYQLELEVTYRHHDALQTDVMKEPAHFTIERDAKKAELHVFSDVKEIFDGDTLSLQKTPFIFDDIDGAKHTFPLTIKNTADSGLPHAGLIIGDFSYNVSFEEDNVMERYANGKTREQVFFISDADAGSNCFEVLQKGKYQIDSKPGGDINLQLVFSEENIIKLFRINNGEQNYNTTLLVGFSFNYWSNDSGVNIVSATSKKGKPFHATLRLPLYQKPCEQWLGIDFGTSAIVCMYDNIPLDLRSRKAELFNDPDPHYESGTVFLSSNTIFRANAVESDKSQLLSENQSQELPDYHSLAVCLSPTWTVERENHRFLLPCLKLIVGHEFLPQLESFPNNQFFYYVGESRERKQLLDENQRPTRLAKVDTILDEVYRELFQFYIRKRLPANVLNEKINRLVLTVPNTFSPNHKKTIESIVKQSLSHLDIRDVCFVSESDAVACYYLKNKYNINRDITRTVESINEVENILVYDMGAGTLDLSLFTIVPDKNDTRRVTVRGRIGLSKAGNYLDFVLANIIADIFEQHAILTKKECIETEKTMQSIVEHIEENEKQLQEIDKADKANVSITKKIIERLFNEKAIFEKKIEELQQTEEYYKEIVVKFKSYIRCNSTDYLDSARAFKCFIKEELKPSLSIGDEDMVLTLEREKYPDLGLPQDIQLSLKDIIGHYRYQEFISDCTEHLISNFFSFLHLVDTDFRLDTVIVSGRSSKLKHIRQALDKVIEPYKRIESFRIYNTSDGPTDVSKIAVVEGAMKFAKEKYSDEPTVTFSNESTITPCYGVIYKDQYGEEHYKELFNPRSASPIEKPSKDGRVVKTYRTEDVILDLRYTDTLYLVQSYSATTEEDWKAETKKMDYISIVQSYSTAHFGRLQNAQLRIEVDSQNMLKLRVNNTLSNDYSPNRIDLSRSSIGDSLWPRVQENKN